MENYVKSTEGMGNLARNDSLYLGIDGCYFLGIPMAGKDIDTWGIQFDLQWRCKKL